jgi:tryptophan synthase
LCFANYLSRPDLSSWKDSGRAQYIVVTDAQALEGFRLLSEMEGIIPALESAHAIWGSVDLAKTMNKDQDLVICVSGGGYVYSYNAARALS